MSRKAWYIVCIVLVAMVACVACAAPQAAPPAPAATPAAVQEAAAPLAEAKAAQPDEPDADDIDDVDEPEDAVDDADDDEYFDLDNDIDGMDEAERQKYLDKANTYEEGDASLRDFYGTDPVPEGMPQPVDDAGGVNKDNAKTATLLIECASIYNYMDRFNMDKAEVLPQDGVIYAAREVVFYEGESVFDLLLREVQNNRIHMEFENVPGYNSNYIEGINNIYEQDCGDLSGWMYSVNGWFPNYGSGRYQLQDGDAVEWHYTCDLGRDFGVTWQRPR